MVTKLTAWKTIAVKDATYAVATKKKPEKKNYLLKVTKVRPRRETFKCDIFRWNKTCHDIFYYHFKRLYIP